MNGAPARRASRREISVLPTPVGPIIRMFFGSTSSRSRSSSCMRRQRLRSAIATARLASPCPMMKRSSSETISRGEKSVMRHVPSEAGGEHAFYEGADEAGTVTATDHLGLADHLIDAARSLRLRAEADIPVGQAV